MERDTSVEIFDRSKNSSRPPQYYNLDVIISVGYRVKSQRGIEFRRWANKVLKDYIIKGYRTFADDDVKWHRELPDPDFLCINILGDNMP